MENLSLSSGEHIIDKITATFEVTENMGIIYKFGDLIATNKRLILYTKYPLIGLSEIAIYCYEDMAQVDTGKPLLSFNDNGSVAVKLVNQGNTKRLLEVIKLFSNHVPGIRSFQ